MTDLENMMSFYRPFYADQTEALFAALQQPREKIALKNPFIQGDSPPSMQTETVLGLPIYPSLNQEPPTEINGLMSHYFLDRSSLYPPLLLPIPEGARVLDMCSAPGGKLLVLLSRKIPGVSIVANDVSAARSFRLKRVVANYVPATFLSTHVTLTTKDAIAFGLKQPEQFDAVLLDAPCSSEGHVVTDATLLKKFKGLSKSLPKRQYALLCAALLALKPGGHVMYATCSINPHENEGVINKLLAKKSDRAELVHLSCSIGQRSDVGISILPHLHNAGPAFFSLLRRR